MDNTSTGISRSNVDNSTSSQQAKESNRLANLSLKYSALFWFLAIMAGQWLFFYYLISFYGLSVINDNMEIWNRWEAMGSSPYKAGDSTGNAMFAAHTIGAGIVAFGGALQLIPKLRSIVPTFHKVNGYIYLTTVMCLALSGFYLSWIREASPNAISAIGTSINGFLIIGFAYLTVKTARIRRVQQHRRWAIRLFLVSNAQWFLRVGVFSYLITGTVMGTEPAFGDPFFSVWTFACFLLPLVTAELYFFASRSNSTSLKLITSLVLMVLTILMLIGVFGLTPFLLQVMSGEPIAF